MSHLPYGLPREHADACVHAARIYIGEGEGEVGVRRAIQRFLIARGRSPK